MRLALLPLDDRPVSIALPAEVVAVAGVEVDTPGAELRPRLRRVPSPAALGDWLADSRNRTDAAIVSLDALGFGSLIASRTGHETVAEVLRNWRPVTVPGPPVHAAFVVPRTPNNSDAMEEPTYWDPHGPALYRLSAALSDGAPLAACHAAVAPDVPLEVVRDWLGRRIRQHTLALAAVDMAWRGSLSTLVLGVDDAAERSLSAVAQADLVRWIDLLGVSDDALVQPGADETGVVLAARALLRATGLPAPSVAIVSATEGGLRRTAPYETGPLVVTGERQILAAGARPVGAGVAADVTVVVHAPAQSEMHGDWAVAPPQRLDQQASRATAELVGRLVTEGRRVGVADVAHPNGADPLLVTALGEAGLWPTLDGYAAWNTAGNTLGTVAAQVVATWVARETGTLDPAAHRRMMARRVAEDYGWMSVLRSAVRAELGSDPARHDVVPVDDDLRRSWETRLLDVLAPIPGFEDVGIRPGSLLLPWDRTFEVDFQIELQRDTRHEGRRIR